MRKINWPTLLCFTKVWTNLQNQNCCKTTTTKSVHVVKIGFAELKWLRNPLHGIQTQNLFTVLLSTTYYGRLNCLVVSHLALIIVTLRQALGHEFEPLWQLTLFLTQAQHLRFLHDSIWFIWFNTIICLSNLSCGLWIRKLKINLQKKLKIVNRKMAWANKKFD